MFPNIIRIIISIIGIPFLVILRAGERRRRARGRSRQLHGDARPPAPRVLR